MYTKRKRNFQKFLKLKLMYKCIFNVLQDKMMKSKIKEIVRKLKICKSYFWEA